MNHFYTNREQWEVLTTGYLSLGYRPVGDWANIWHWTKRFTISFSDNSSSSGYFHIFSLIAFLEEAFIRNIIVIIIRVNYIIRTCNSNNNNNNNNTILNNNLWKTPRPYFARQFSHNQANGFLPCLRTIWGRAPQSFANPVLHYSSIKWDKIHYPCYMPFIKFLA